jgi:3-deoxy-D-manno-octulosonic acid kinase
VILPLGFEWVRERRAAVLARSDVRDWLVPLLRQAGSGWAGYSARPLAGGRGGATVVQINANQVVVRPCRRGGLRAWVLPDLYFGWMPRPFREVCATETLRQRGAPVVEVYGACVRWLAPGCYKGWVATRYALGARTLWEWLRAAPGAAERAVVVRQVGRAIRRLHESGGRHPDLNLNNILVCPAADPPTVLFIDFDRSPTSASRCHPPRAELMRLRRSARKLDPEGQWVTPADLDGLQAAYRDAHGCA